MFIILLLLLLATSFGLKSRSSGQYLQKNLKMLIYVVQTKFILWDAIYIH